MNRLKNICSVIFSFCQKITDDHVAPFAAQAAFFVLLSFFPLVMVILTASRYLPFQVSDLYSALKNIVPVEFQSILLETITEIYTKASPTLFTITILGTLWSASKGVMAIYNGLNSVYDIAETRNYFIIRFIATIYTFIFCLILVFCLCFLVFGNSIYAYVCRTFPVAVQVADRIIGLRNTIVVIVLVLFFDMIYCFIPNRKSTLLREVPGALFATAGWMAVSYFISIFFTKFTNFSYMYGSLSTIILVFLWMYFCMQIIFIGGEINRFIYQNYITEVRRIRRRISEKRRNSGE